MAGGRRARSRDGPRLELGGVRTLPRRASASLACRRSALRRLRIRFEAVIGAFRSSLARESSFGIPVPLNPEVAISPNVRARQFIESEEF
eukprot:4715129-Alexandrium_andersonii.AAC.1